MNKIVFHGEHFLSTSIKDRSFSLEALTENLMTQVGNASHMFFHLTSHWLNRKKLSEMGTIRKVCYR